MQPIMGRSPRARMPFARPRHTGCTHSSPGPRSIRQTRPMETAEFVESLDREGRLLAAAAEAAGTDAKVPTCPEWQVRDLVRHTGMVHRWAAAFVAEGHTSYHPDGGLPDLDGEELLA